MLFTVLTHYAQTALFGALVALVSPVGESPELASEPDDDDSDVVERDARQCSASSNTSATGRQFAMVRNSPREPWICLRFKFGGEAPQWLEDCWKAAKRIGCTEVVDVD